MKFLRQFFFILICIQKVFAQSQTKEYTEADDLFANNQFAAIWPYYQNLLKTDSLNADLNFKMGICYLNSRSQKQKAVDCFKNIITTTNNQTIIPLITFKLLAEACYIASNYDQAIINYERYKSALLATKSDNQAWIEEINQKIELCKIKKELKELKELTTILINHNFENSKNIISPGNSYNPSADRLSYTLTQKKSFNLNQPMYDKDFFEDDNTIPNEAFYSSTSTDLDTSSIPKEATIATSVDGQIMLIYRNDKGDGNLYASSLADNEWTVPVQLNKIINTKGWEPNEFISADGNTLYFSSSRQGGYGGKDIYKCVKLFNGEWGKAVNMGPAINSPHDEEAPFIHPDGTTLFFSSNRYKTKGGFDIFTSSLSENGTWAVPTSIGYPLHKEKGNVNLKEKNNYMVTFINQKKAPITLVKGDVIDKNEEVPKNIEITVTNNETGEIAGIYHSSGRTGQYLFILPPGKNNNITYEAKGYLFHSENIDLSKEVDFYKTYNTVKLVPLAVDEKSVLNNVFFDEKNKTSLKPTSYVELNKLYSLLIMYPKLIIELSFNKENTADDTKLSDDKIQSVKNYFIEKGITKDRLVTKVYQTSKKSKKKTANKISEKDTSGKLEIKILAI